jgi:hypothetical protein
MAPDRIDSLFQTAVAAIDTGDIPALQRVLASAPGLVGERLHAPGPWLENQVGSALDRFFRAPYLLWFVAEDPVRNGRLPSNIADVARTIIETARREEVPSFQEQIDFALRLVCWSWIARECGVQIGLIDVLVDAGASMDGAPDDALVNGNLSAAEHLLTRGAKLTLPTAVALQRWEDAERLAQQATSRGKQGAFILAALHGNARGLRILLDAGAEINQPSPDLYAHASALHHAVWSGSLDAVRILVEAGADVHARDHAEDATPLGWAEYAESGSPPERAAQYAEIAKYLRTQ